MIASRCQTILSVFALILSMCGAQQPAAAQVVPPYPVPFAAPVLELAAFPLPDPAPQDTRDTILARFDQGLREGQAALLPLLKVAIRSHQLEAYTLDREYYGLALHGASTALIGQIASQPAVQSILPLDGGPADLARLDAVREILTYQMRPTPWSAPIPRPPM